MYSQCTLDNPRAARAPVRSAWATAVHRGWPTAPSQAVNGAVACGAPPKRKGGEVCWRRLPGHAGHGTQAHDGQDAHQAPPSPRTCTPARDQPPSDPAVTPRAAVRAVRRLPRGPVAPYRPGAWEWGTHRGWQAATVGQPLPTATAIHGACRVASKGGAVGWVRRLTVASPAPTSTPPPTPALVSVRCSRHPALAGTR